MGRRTRRDLQHLHTHHKGAPWVASCLEGTDTNSMSKEGALAAVTQGFHALNVLTPEDEKRITGLISLFSLTAEDLLEAGIDYETLRAVQRRFFITD
jgi:molybdopterin-guanine dinucleotide biosynthesis protein